MERRDGGVCGERERKGTRGSKGRKDGAGSFQWTQVLGGSH